ncbi:early nodulin-like protein 21, partial [Primulina tabacum]|uniref:early nodulin-like protein 21 n=1 Tax=Primulina tabacum TaxID=48773 RepID=UPI003F5A9223
NQTLIITSIHSNGFYSFKISFSSVFHHPFYSLRPAFGFEFPVRSWRRGSLKIPTGEEPETYNEWAAQNRFQIGDTLHFKYQNDSVLVVSSADYLNWNTANPISEFKDGSSVFQFDRSGFYYFMSGKPGHFNSGQRLIVRVMHPSEIGVPSSAPAPAPADGADGGGSDYLDWGPPAGVNSGIIKLDFVSFSTIGLCGLLYLFI